MPTFAEALESQKGADPLGSFLNGYKTGLAGAQARDVSARDQSKLAMEAVAQAERAKAQNVNQMLDRMKMAQDDRQFNDTLALKAEELKIRKDQFTQNLDFLNRGVNPRTGQSYGSTGIDTFIPEKFRVTGGGGGAAADSVGAVTSGSSSASNDANNAAPLPEPGDMLAGSPGGDLLPGDTFGAPSGSRADVNVVTDLPSGGSNSPSIFDKAPPAPDVPDAPTISPGANTPMGEPPATSVAPNLPEVLESPAAPAAPSEPAAASSSLTAPPMPVTPPRTLGPVAQAIAKAVSLAGTAPATPGAPEPRMPLADVASQVLTSQRNLQDGLQAQLDASGASAQEAARFAQEAGSELRNKRLSPEHQRDLKESMNKAASIFGEEKQRIASLAKKVADETAKTKFLEERSNLLAGINDLSNVLPAKDYLKIAKAAMTPVKDPNVEASLKDLSVYNEVRQANNLTYPSKGITTARNVAKIYADSQTKEVRESAQSEMESYAVARDVIAKSNLLASPEGKALAAGERKLLEKDIEGLVKKHTDLSNNGLKYRAQVTAFDEALKADGRPEPKKPAPSGTAAAAPAAPAPVQEVPPDNAPGVGIVSKSNTANE